MSDLTAPEDPVQSDEATGDPGAPDTVAGEGAPEVGGTEAPSEGDSPEPVSEGAPIPAEEEPGNPALGIAPQDAQPPGAEVVPLDTSVAVQGTSSGEDATIAVKHDSGATFFHTLGTIPKRFLDEAGQVIFGRHLNVPLEEAEKDPAPGPAEEPVPEEEPAPQEDPSTPQGSTPAEEVPNPVTGEPPPPDTPGA